MPRSRTAHGAATSTQFADSFVYFEDAQSHSQLYSQPRHIPDYGDYAGYDMSGDEYRHEAEEDETTTNETWDTHLRRFELMGPGTFAVRNGTLNPAMVITIESRGPTKRTAQFSHASVRALRVHDSSEVPNGAVSVTGVQVGQTVSTVTMEFRFDNLRIEEAGQFYYDICVYGMDTTTSLSPKILVMWGEKVSEVITIND